MDYKKFLTAVILSGIVYIIASSILSMVTQMIMPFSWTDVGGMRTLEDPVMMWFVLYGFVLSIGAVLLYPLISLKGTLIQKGAKFGVLMWVATNVSSAFVIYTTMTYPAGFYLNGLIFGVLIWVLMGITIAWVYKAKAKKPAKVKKKK